MTVIFSLFKNTISCFQRIVLQSGINNFNQTIYMLIICFDSVCQGAVSLSYCNEVISVNALVLKVCKTDNSKV